MARPNRLPFILSVAVVCAFAVAAASPLQAQRGSGPLNDAAQLDRDGATEQALAIYQSVLDTVSDPADRARVQRSMAMSYAFAGDCANTIRYEQMVIDYWRTQEEADPQNAFYQEGEMADEGARVCVDVGDLDTAEEWYRRGHELGLKEPEPRTHPASLWDYRLAHALGRIAARRGDVEEARRQIAAARAALDGDPEMAAQQERFFPYLTGYVALFTGDLEKAEADLTTTVEMRGNQNDPFMNTLLAMTWERMGRTDEANELYRKAYDMARAHNPPAAFVRRFVREKLGL
jgi:tetratricopeptide (TPR) repeat protein